MRGGWCKLAIIGFAQSVGRWRRGSIGIVEGVGGLMRRIMSGGSVRRVGMG